MNEPILFTRKALIAYLLQHESEFPDKDDYQIEIRDRLVAYPPSILRHDDDDRVLILGGIQHR